MLWGQNNENKDKDLIMSIVKTKIDLNINIKNYQFAEPEQVDYYLYQIKAIQAKLGYLIKKAKENKVELNNVEKIKYDA